MLIPDNVAIYVDGGANADVYSAQIIDSYEEIKNNYISRGFDFFLPINHLGQVKSVFRQYVQDNLQYNFPHRPTALETEIGYLLRIIDFIPAYDHRLYQALGLPDDIDSPCIIERQDSKQEIYYYPENGSRTFRDWVETPWLSQYSRDSFSFGAPRLDKSKEYDPDDDLTYQEIAFEIEEKIKQLGNARAYKLLAGTLLNLARECGVEQDRIDQVIRSSALLSSADSSQFQHLSRLVIDDDYKVFLPAYNNLEIKIPTLSKVVFIFFLKHPEGILFKEIGNHREEIRAIYYKITNRSETDSLDKSLEDLVNPTSNSLNEKCSRIKEAFVSAMGNDLARHYYVSGGRGQNKRIVISRDLVELSF